MDRRENRKMVFVIVWELLRKLYLYYVTFYFTCSKQDFMTPDKVYYRQFYIILGLLMEKVFTGKSFLVIICGTPTQIKK